MKVVAVIGATGSQGGGVARRLQQSGEWQVRGITRNVNSKSAQGLKSEGMDVVAADLDDHASLMAAFKVSPPHSPLPSRPLNPPPNPNPNPDPDPLELPPQPRDPCS
jgi:hypothetical protein